MESKMGVAVSKGLARVCESVFPPPSTLRAGPEGRTEGAPNIPDGGGVPEGGACPLLPEGGGELARLHPRWIN
jgi:hypothetical protein